MFLNVNVNLKVIFDILNFTGYQQNFCVLQFLRCRCDIGLSEFISNLNVPEYTSGS